MTTPSHVTDAPRRLEVELLALDLDTCRRCTATAASLDAALEAVLSVLRDAGVDVDVRRTVVRTRAEAEALRFVTSPTIRVDGRDIALELRESPCADCGSLCGCDGGIDCRVWVWRGREYTEAPKAMIVDAVLRGYAATGPRAPHEAYRMPDNLRRFFDEKRTGPASCCGEGAGS